jgi:hypothetical protein
MSNYAEWAHKQILERRPTTAVEPKMAHEELVRSLAAVSGNGGQLFGVNLSNFDPESWPQLRSALVDVLCEWKARYEANDALTWLFELDECARRFGIEQLRLTKRVPLRCDPLGSRDGLSAQWLDRLAKLDAVRAGQATLELAAVGFDPADSDDESTIVLGDPDDDALYRSVLSIERAESGPFPRELAALWSVANGIFVDDCALLEPAREWRDVELGKLEGLRIGAGSYLQGNLLVIGNLARGVDRVRLVETDDEVVTREYASITQFVDLLFGVKSGS